MANLINLYQQVIQGKNKELQAVISIIDTTLKY
jgi:hypothetical protein